RTECLEHHQHPALVEHDRPLGGRNAWRGLYLPAPQLLDRCGGEGRYPLALGLISGLAALTVAVPARVAVGSRSRRQGQRDRQADPDPVQDRVPGADIAEALDGRGADLPLLAANQAEYLLAQLMVGV